MTQASAPYAAGTAFIDGRYMPIAEAAMKSGMRSPMYRWEM